MGGDFGLTFTSRSPAKRRVIYILLPAQRYYSQNYANLTTKENGIDTVPWQIHHQGRLGLGWKGDSHVKWSRRTGIFS